MKDISTHFALGVIDHDELLFFLGSRYRTAWRIGASEIDLPAERRFSVRVRHRYGRIERIWAGPALTRKVDVDALVRDFHAETNDVDTHEIGRGTLTASKPMHGGLRCGSVSIQFLPTEVGTPVPAAIQAQHPFVVEFPLPISQNNSMRFWRRYKVLVEYAWVINVLLNSAVRVHPPRARSMWIRAPELGNKFVFGSEQIPDATSQVFASALSPQPSPAPSISAGIYDGEQTERTRAILAAGLEDQLVLPDNLEVSLARFQRLKGIERDRFLRAAAAVYLATHVWEESMSTHLLSCVQAIESVAQELPQERRVALFFRIPIGPARRFRNICERYGESSGVDRKTLRTLYDVRSNLIHGRNLLQFDRRPWGLSIISSVLGMEDLDAAWSAGTLAKAVLRGWLSARAIR